MLWLIGILLLASLLRLWSLDKVPVSLFGDELDLGYQAYSILKTGKDYSGNSWPLHFQSLAEWRTPLYLYSAVPTVAIFGISPYGVRLPAAIFGILGVLFFYLLVQHITKNEKIGLIAALLLAISPWHLQYSRAGFEVTQMLALYLGGLYFFLKGLDKGKYMAVSALLLGLTPWAYSTAKFYLPLTLIFLFFIWKKEIFSVNKKHLLLAALVFFVIVTPIAWSTLYGGGAARFSYISVFTDPTTIPEVGFSRLHDGKMANPVGSVGLQPTLVDRAIHNKYTWWGGAVLENYLKSFSTQFLFINGDSNARHAVQGAGEFFKFEGILMVLGLVFLLTCPLDKKYKVLILIWLLSAPVPSALTREGGTHATRLFFLLPVLVFLISWAIYHILQSTKKYQTLLAIAIVGLYLASFGWYQHQYWVHYPWDSERWWHAGFEDSVKTAVSTTSKYDKVIFSNNGEPVLIFFLGWSQFDPAKFHSEYPLIKENIANFGSISKLDKYYFGQPSPGVDLYTLGSILPENTLYISTHKEVQQNLILEPERLPADLNLIKAVAYPSGEPAYYLFEKK